MTNREYLNQMDDDTFADWLCKQMFLDYDADDFINVARFQTVRNFLKMEHVEEDGRTAENPIQEA